MLKYFLGIVSELLIAKQISFYRKLEVFACRKNFIHECELEHYDIN